MGVLRRTAVLRSSTACRQPSSAVPIELLEQKANCGHVNKKMRTFVARTGYAILGFCRKCARRQIAALRLAVVDLCCAVSDLGMGLQ